MSKPVNRKVQAALAERWPHLFHFPVPLKIGIHRDYPAPGDRPVSKKVFARFLKKWVKQPAYQAALQSGTARYGFDGSMHPMEPQG